MDHLFKSASIVFILLIWVSTAVAEQRDRFVITGPNWSLAQGRVPGLGGKVIRRIRFAAGFTAKLTPAAVEKLRAQYGTKIHIEKDVIVQISLVSAGTPQFTAASQSTPYNIDQVHAPFVFSRTKGAGVTVCVIDTGIDASHPDLSDRVIGGYNLVAKDGVTDPNAWSDDNQHGTHVAGTIAASDNALGVVGVAPEASLFAVKALDAEGRGFISDVADGIRACVDRAGARVINMSFASPQYSPLMLREAISYAAHRGVILVAAAGNSGRSVEYPAALPDVIAVSAVTAGGILASFSNRGPEIRFAGPGTSVTSTVPGGGYAAFNGTSMASPHVAGVAALVLAAGGSAENLRAHNLGLPSDHQGQGLIDAQISLDSIPQPPFSPPALPPLGVFAVLPSSRSAVVGQPVTVNMSVINISGLVLNNFRILQASNLPVALSFQRVTSSRLTPANEALSGIQINETVNFILTITPQAAFGPQHLKFKVVADGVKDATSTVEGVDTLLLSASVVATPDIVALVGVASNDGILHLDATARNGAFVVATSSVGAAGRLTVVAEATGAAAQGLKFSLCNTAPLTGQCVTPVAPQVTLDIASGAQPTFAIFVNNPGGAIPLDPGANRIFVKFVEVSTGATRGATSLAVEQK